MCRNNLRNWFKGDDTRTLCSFLEAKFKNMEDSHPDHEHIEYITCIHCALRASNQFLGTLYRAGLWLTDRQRAFIIRSVGDLLRNFSRCAEISFSMGLIRFKYQPKFHLVAELRYNLQADAERKVPSINPLAWSCQLDEDFIGKVATQSRKVSSRKLHLKVCERYLISLCASW